jgi:hypothetical protein
VGSFSAAAQKSKKTTKSIICSNKSLRFREHRRKTDFAEEFAAPYELADKGVN